MIAAAKPASFAASTHFTLHKPGHICCGKARVVRGVTPLVAWQWDCGFVSPRRAQAALFWGGICVLIFRF